MAGMVDVGQSWVSKRGNRKSGELEVGSWERAKIGRAVAGPCMKPQGYREKVGGRFRRLGWARRFFSAE